jgi:ribose 5-phosphate isomerase B
MRLLIASDHAGFKLKEELKTYLTESGHEVTDFGAQKLQPEDDYPDFVIPVAKAVVANPLSRGIIIGGSGQGEAICANRFAGVRAVVYYGKTGPNLDMIIFTRDHNDANILSLGARFLSVGEAKEAITAWLQTPFSNDPRHVRRLVKIEELSKNA